MSSSDAKQLQLLIDKVNSLSHKVDHLVSRRMCFRCKGTGIIKVGEKDCNVCNSTGWTTETNQQVLDRTAGKITTPYVAPQQQLVASDQMKSTNNGAASGGADDAFLGGVAL